MAKKLLHSLSALCFLSVSGIGIAVASDFIVEGKVYCDTCRAGFENSATYYIPGAKVKIECRNMTNNQVTTLGEGQTDKWGKYKLPVHDNHEDEICEVSLLSSPLENCNEIKLGRDRAPILLTHNNGIISTSRFANPLGFLMLEPLPVCAQLFQQYLRDDDS